MKSAVRQITFSIALLAAVFLCGQKRLTALPLPAAAASDDSATPAHPAKEPAANGQRAESPASAHANATTPALSINPPALKCDVPRNDVPAPADSNLSGNLLLAAGSNAGVPGSVDAQTVGDISGTMSDRLLIAGAPKAMTGSVPSANIFSVHVATGDAAGGKVKFTIVASDGINYAMETGEMIFLANPNGMNCAVVVAQYSAIPPAYTNTVLAIPPIGQSGSLNAQCLGATFGGDPGLVIFDTNPTSFTPVTHKLYYTIENQSQAALTLQP